MDKNKCINRQHDSKYSVQSNNLQRSSRYNYKEMKNETIVAKEGFAKRLTELREKANVSAREMSLSLGQGTGYINNIENGHNFPSLAMFFELCEFLDVTPFEFFNYTQGNNSRDKDLILEIENLDKEEKEIISKLIKKLNK